MYIARDTWKPSLENWGGGLHDVVCKIQTFSVLGHSYHKTLHDHYLLHTNNSQNYAALIDTELHVHVYTYSAYFNLAQKIKEN